MKEETTAHSKLRTEYQELKTTLAQKEEHFTEQLALLKESRELLKKEFEVVANDILDKKGKAFSELSEKNITGLLQPIQTEMKDFRVKIETLHLEDTKQHASLKTELKHLQELNREITDQAQHLTEALRGQKKLQGNWGELILERVLEGSGLRQGTDYQLEQSFNTEEGRRRPDAVVYLPQNKHLIIDAKTSLESYIQYVNSEDDEFRGRAQAAHARAVSDRIKELSNKNYYDLPGLNSPEVVVMFIPVESAYVEALRYDESIFQRAIDNNVLVATPTTVLTSLNIVRQLWRFQDQSKHSAELASRAEKFHTKLTLFLESMLDVEKKLDHARGSYDKAMGQLVNGRGNLIKQAGEFSELGVAVKREIPDQYLERSRLELSVSGASVEATTNEVSNEAG